MMVDEYRFKFEIIESTVTEVATAITDDDLDATLRGQVETLEGEGDTEILVLPRSLAGGIGALAVMRLGERAVWATAARSAAGLKLALHEGCANILAGRLAERNDLIGAVNDARTFCQNELSTAPGIGLYVSLYGFLEALRPNLKRPRRLPEPFECPECGSSLMHDEDCSLEKSIEDQRRASRQEIEAHARCGSIADELATQIDALLLDIEEVALRARTHAHELDGAGDVVNPHVLLEDLSLDGLAAGEDLARPTSITGQVVPPLDNLDYCRDDWHSTPHRACRYLIE